MGWVYGLGWVGPIMGRPIDLKNGPGPIWARSGPMKVGLKLWVIFIKYAEFFGFYDGKLPL